jgi:hypothetical protein
MCREFAAASVSGHHTIGSEFRILRFVLDVSSDMIVPGDNEIVPSRPVLARKLILLRFMSWKPTIPSEGNQGARNQKVITDRK